MPFKSFLKFFPTKQALSWAFYDFANSSYSLLIMTFVFPIFFRDIIAAGAEADLWWGLAVGVSVFLSGMASPVIGAIADYDFKRKRKFVTFALLSILGTALLYFTGPGKLLLTFLIFVFANTCFEIAITLYDSFLLQVSTRHTAGRISGLGWGLGYLGGVVAMLLFEPLYNGGYTAGSPYTLTFLATALFFLVFSLPAFLFMKENNGVPKKEKFKTLLKVGFSKTFQTIKRIRQYGKIARFLVGFYLLNNALVTIFVFVPLFGKVTLGMSFSEIAQLLLIVQFVGFPSTLFFGWLSDKKGPKKIVLATLVLWIFVVVGLLFASSKMFFVTIAVLAGLIIGSSQAVARSWFSRLVPREKKSEFFGFHGFASRIGATTGPILFGIISSVTGNQRIALATLLVYLVMAIFVFAGIKEER